MVVEMVNGDLYNVDLMLVEWEFLNGLFFLMVV
jgi:hypothetical protein